MKNSVSWMSFFPISNNFSRSLSYYHTKSTVPFYETGDFAFSARNPLTILIFSIIMKMIIKTVRQNEYFPGWVQRTGGW